ncbi:SGNH/GDSL hydrolase family protein [Gryllotalpicola protaetiae]|uniref:SGNH/GDSL hydrolase family protein n=1 Tax=Gryllotalpicola protaetiae TaxID=2419771 RepID=A0A387BNY1_9MICO|nr:SGNH/GDSL hydrolase family protein [Gryllotalpicola protaetiae]AYG04172.1 SGNH/GDSL hydrolase family protein [Gryllotalpicola protaetiae]
MPRNPQRPVGGTGVLTYVGVAVLLVAAVAVAVFALTKNSGGNLSAVAAGYTPPTLSSAESTPAVAPSTSPAATASSPAPTRSAPASDHPARVVFVGDGYAHSDDATDAAHGFPALVGAAEGWKVDVVSCALAGYVAKGSCGTNYAGLIPQIVAASPDIVIVTGGRNDVPSAASTAAAATDFFTQLAAAVPAATVYAVSPVWDSSHGQAALGVVQQAVQTAARAHGASYLDIGEPLRDHPEFITAGSVLPNDAGYAALAAAIEKALPPPSAG